MTVNVIDSVKHRQYYTRHGLHLNGSGKEVMALKISKQIAKLSLTNNTTIPLYWKDVDSVYPKDITCIPGNLTSSRTSGRIRKHPSTRSEDFLWIGSTSTKV
jgi:hypothetical protein